MEMVERTLVLLDRARRIWNFLNAIESIRDWFYNLHPYLQMFLFSVFLAPFEALYQDTLSSLQDLVNHLVPSAQEPSCPFLGLRSLSYEDCPVNECLLAVLHLSASAAGAITMIVGGVCICSCLDVMDLLRLFDKKSPLKPVNFVTSSAMVDHSTMNKFKKIVLKVIANGLSEQETVALTKDAAGGIITVCDLKGVIKRGGSQLTNSEVTALFNAIDMDSSGAISSAEFIAATLQMSYMGSPSGFSLYGFGAIGLVTMDDAAHDCRAMFWTLPVSRSLP